jgi:hypothetical protein
MVDLDTNDSFTVDGSARKNAPQGVSRPERRAGLGTWLPTDSGIGRFALSILSGGILRQRPSQETARHQLLRHGPEQLIVQASHLTRKTCNLC